MSMKFETIITIDRLLVEAERNSKNDLIEARRKLDEFTHEFFEEHDDVSNRAEVWRAFHNDETYIALRKSIFIASSKYTNVCNALLQFEEYEYENFEVK